MITKCKSCGADIMFVTTPAGRQTPVDLKPKKLWVKDPDEHIWALCDCHESHFSTCPNAAEHRKPVTPA
jgi:hypothetical protein